MLECYLSSITCKYDMYNAAIVAKLTKQSYPILHPASYSAKWLYRTLSYPIQYHPNLGIRVTCK